MIWQKKTSRWYSAMKIQRFCVQYSVRHYTSKIYLYFLHRTYLNVVLSYILMKQPKENKIHKQKIDGWIKESKIKWNKSRSILSARESDDYQKHISIPNSKLDRYTLALDDDIYIAYKMNCWCFAILLSVQYFSTHNHTYTQNSQQPFLTSLTLGSVASPLFCSAWDSG